jgi:hypothetical protein
LKLNKEAAKMNKDEILTLSQGRELNIRVAEDIMGNRCIIDSFFGDMECISDAWAPLRHYSEDRSAAEQVLEKLKGYNPRVEFNSEAESWEADFGYGAVSSSSKSEAICKAALMAVIEAKMSEEVPKEEPQEKESLIEKILEIEIEMFKKVSTREPSLCKERPNTFKAMRRMGHSVLNLQTLNSYLEDLEKAKNEGRNLMTEKYARMDNKIIPIKRNRAIDSIVEIESNWMKNLSYKYPYTFRGSNDFSHYLRCELETYSDKTLYLYLRDVSQAENTGRNLIEESYTRLFQQLYHKSIAEAEQSARDKAE